MVYHQNEAHRWKHVDGLQTILTCKLGKPLLVDLEVQGKKVKVFVLTATN